MTTDADKVREDALRREFELAVVHHVSTGTALPHNFRMGVGYYRDPRTEELWKLWQAASPPPQAAVPEDVLREPSIEQLSVAWTKAITMRGIAGAGTEALIELQRLRDARCTWFGEDENRMRVCLDEYLRNAQ